MLEGSGSLGRGMLGVFGSLHKDYVSKSENITNVLDYESFCKSCIGIVIVQGNLYKWHRSKFVY